MESAAPEGPPPPRTRYPPEELGWCRECPHILQAENLALDVPLDTGRCRTSGDGDDDGDDFANGDLFRAYDV